MRKQGWQGREAKFIVDLEEGKYDALANAVENGTALPGGGETRAPAGDEMLDTEEHEDHILEQENTNESEGANADSETNGTATAGNGDGVRTLRADEVSVMPEGNQVMIRTIPPDIGRVKLEDVGFHGTSCVLSSADHYCT